MSEYTEPDICIVCESPTSLCVCSTSITTLSEAAQRIAELEFVLDCPPTARAAKREDGFIKEVAKLNKQISELEARLKTCLDNCAMHERNETAAVEKHFALLERLEALPAGFDDPYLEDQIKRIIKEAQDD